ncbi:MAG: beta strand repeat-containing protein [Terriglobia bacterium]
MTQQRNWVWLALSLFGAATLCGQQPSAIPRLIKFTGEINPHIAQIAQTKENESGKGQLPTVLGVTFSLYELQEGGSPLWSESQKVQLDEQGRYTVLLGATQPEGLPLDLFTSGKALWLAVQPQLPGAVEEPRVLLVAVPYALKAADADTLGGKPASAYALAGSQTLQAPSTVPGSSSSSAAAQSSNPTTSGAQTPQPGAPCSSVTSDGTATANSIAIFTTACNLESSAITQTSGNIGISGASPANTKFQITDTPAADSGIHYTNHELLNTSVTVNGTNKDLAFVMDLSNTKIPAGVTDSGYRVGVEGAAYANTAAFAGTLGAQYGVWGRAGIANATAGATVTNAYAGYFDLFNSVVGTTITNAYGVFIANSATTGTINNRYDLYAASANAKSYFAGNVGIGTTNPAAKLEVNGAAKFDLPVTFAVTQTFPGANVTGTVPLAAAAGNATDLGGVAASNYARLDIPNTFTGTQTITNGNLSISSGAGNIFVGVGAGNSGMHGGNNVGIGPQVLSANTTGQGETATGDYALQQNTTGQSNTAVGFAALISNTTGSDNTASGFLALEYNTTGSANTATGHLALSDNVTGVFNTATGEYALYDNTGGASNTADGVGALASNTTGSFNTAIGEGTLAGNTTGSSDTAVGAQAGTNQANTLTASNSTFVGANATATVDGLVNATAIGYSAQVAESSALVLGGTGVLAVNVGIGTAAPQYALDVHGTGNFTAPVTFTAGQTFPGTGTITGVTAGAGLFGGGTTGNVPLAVQTCPSGEFLQSTGSGWVCASVGGGGGPITGLTAGTDLTGGGSSGVVILNLDTTHVPQLGTPNTFTATQTVSSGDLSITNGNLDLPDTTGAMVGVINFSGAPFIHECCPNSTRNIFVGIGAGNFTADATSSNGGLGRNTATGYRALQALTSGYANTATGEGALMSNTTGYANMAFGGDALQANTMGNNNTASGGAALVNNTAGNNNTASGYDALYANTTGSNNTAVGYGAAGVNTPTLPSTGSNSTFLGANATATADGLTNATAIGYSAQVGESNALVLGGAGSNAVNVGIGVSAPSDALDINNTIGTNILVGQNNSTNKFRVDSTGQVFADGGYQSNGADFAESVAVRGNRSQYEPGDLLVIDPSGERRLALAQTPYSTLVAGIYSTKPGVLATPHTIDDPAVKTSEVPLAVVGIVPCKVTAENGPIGVGDLLVTSSRAGYAMKGTDRQRLVGAVVGKALEALPQETGVIQVLVTLQ